jgi:hypothetical protein
LASPDLPKELILFLSVDVVNSTAYKHDNTTDQVQPWLPFFVQFFNQFRGYFERHIRSESQLGQDPFRFFRGQKVDIPRLWKMIGDEQVFTVKLTHYKQALLYVDAFRDAVREYEKEIDDKFDLSLKATAWVAGFPVGNAKIVIKEDEGKRVDYIGPLIDIGFRLAKFASPKKFVVSVDLALLLMHDNSQLRFHYDGKVPLKGVLGDQGYPVIWVAIKEDNEDLEQRLFKKTDESELQSFCGRYIEDTGRPMMRPFIDGDGIFNEVPDYYEEEYQQIAELWTHEDSLKTEGRKPTEKKKPSDEDLDQLESKLPQG